MGYATANRDLVTISPIPSDVNQAAEGIHRPDWAMRTNLICAHFWRWERCALLFA